MHHSNGSAERIWTVDLQLMRLVSCQTSLPRKFSNHVIPTENFAISSIFIHHRLSIVIFFISSSFPASNQWLSNFVGQCLSRKGVKLETSKFHLSASVITISLHYCSSTIDKHQNFYQIYLVCQSAPGLMTSCLTWAWSHVDLNLNFYKKQAKASSRSFFIIKSHQLSKNNIL